MVFDVTSAKLFLTIDGQVDFFGVDVFVTHHFLQANLLEVQDDLHYIFYNATDGTELMIDTSDAHCRNCIAFQGREQHPAKGVTYSLTEAWFKGFKLKKTFKIVGFLHYDLVRLLEIKNAHMRIMDFEKDELTGLYTSERLPTDLQTKYVEALKGFILYPRIVHSPAIK